MGGTYSTYGEKRSVFRVLVEKPMEKDFLEDPGVDGRIILREWVIWLKIGRGKNGNELTTATKYGVFLL
jgi:hypothetical protein